MIEHDMPVPDDVQGFKLLDEVNLSEDQFESMEIALKCLFTVHPDNDENDALKSVSLNQEEGYYF